MTYFDHLVLKLSRFWAEMALNPVRYLYEQPGFPIRCVCYAKLMPDAYCQHTILPNGYPQKLHCKCDTDILDPAGGAVSSG